MNGMELMLKAVGFDPAEFQQFLGGMKTALEKFNADLEAIKSKQMQLEQNQRVLIGLLSNDKPTELEH